MTNDEYIEIYNRFAELPDRLKATEQQRESAEQFARFLNEKQADIEPYSAVCAEIEQLCTSGDVGSNEIYDKIRHEIESLKELTVALEQMNDAEAAISCSDMASITAESQRLQVFCNKEMTLEQLSDAIERVKKMTDSLKEAFKKEKKMLNEIVDNARSSIWGEDAEKIKKKITKTSVLDDDFISELKMSISDAQKERQDDINEMLKKHRCLRVGGRMYEEHNKLIKRHTLEIHTSMGDYRSQVQDLVEKNNAIIGIICSSIGVLLCGITIFLGFSYWGFEADEFSGLFSIILGSLSLISLLGFIWHRNNVNTTFWEAIGLLIVYLLSLASVGFGVYVLGEIIIWIFEFISGLFD